MDALGIALVGMGVWTCFCAVRSYNPLTMLGAVLRDPEGVASTFSQASENVKSSAASSALGGSGGSIPTAVIPSSGSGPTGNVDEGLSLSSDAKTAAYQNYAFQILAQHGLDNPQQRAALVDLWNHESGWNPDAVNKSSGAYGIPQILPSAHPDAVGLNADQQIVWGVNYIVGRYGTPVAAWHFERSHTPNWY